MDERLIKLHCHLEEVLRCEDLDKFKGKLVEIQVKFTAVKTLHFRGLQCYTFKIQNGDRCTIKDSLSAK